MNKPYIIPNDIAPIGGCICDIHLNKEAHGWCCPVHGFMTEGFLERCSSCENRVYIGPPVLICEECGAEWI